MSWCRWKSWGVVDGPSSTLNRSRTSIGFVPSCYRHYIYSCLFRLLQAGCGCSSRPALSWPRLKSTMCMPKLFLVAATVLLTLITTVQAFQLTNLFNSPQIVPQTPKMSTEQTFIAIKPDGVMRGLVGEIISRFEKRG